MPLPFQRVRPVEVFAVATRSVQVTWRDAPSGPVEVRVRPASGAPGAAVTAAVDDAAVVAGRGAGAVEVPGLEPGTPHLVEVRLGRGGRVHRLAARTLPEPQGRRLARIATVSDLHLGEDGFGLLRPLRERPSPAEPHPVRCTRAAIRAAARHGAELLVAKGDLTHDSRPEEWAALTGLLAEAPLPVLLVAGNHDDVRSGRPATAELARLGQPREPVRVHDHGGVRVLLVDSTVRGHDRGTLSAAQAALAGARAAEWPGPVLVLTHHNLERLPFPWFWPPGTPKGQADRLLDALAAGTPRAFVSSGHTHRHRYHRRRAVPVTEVGSPKDFPGVWAAYDVHEDGIVQVVRRIEDPDCIAWTETCRRAAGGTWGRWAPGTLGDRCLTVRFPPGP